MRMSGSQGLGIHIAGQFDNPRIALTLRGIREWRVHISPVQSGRADDTQTSSGERDPNRTPGGLVEGGEGVSLEGGTNLVRLD